MLSFSGFIFYQLLPVRLFLLVIDVQYYVSSSHSSFFVARIRVFADFFWCRPGNG